MFHLVTECKTGYIETAVIKWTYIVIIGVKIRTIYGIPSHLCERGTVGKRRASNACHAVTYGHLRECGAAGERPVSNACHAVAYGYLLKCGAVLEHIVSNACHAVGYSHLCECVAAVERIWSLA